MEWGLWHCPGRRPGGRKALGMEVLPSRQAFLALSSASPDKKGIRVRLKEITVLFSPHGRSSLRPCSRGMSFPCCRVAPWHWVLVLTLYKLGRGDKDGSGRPKLCVCGEKFSELQRSVWLFHDRSWLETKEMRRPCFSLPCSVPYRAMFLVSRHGQIRQFEVLWPFCLSV